MMHLDVSCCLVCLTPRPHLARPLCRAVSAWQVLHTMHHKAPTWTLTHARCGRIHQLILCACVLHLHHAEALPGADMDAGQGCRVLCPRTTQAETRKPAGDWQVCSDYTSTMHAACIAAAVVHSGIAGVGRWAPGAASSCTLHSFRVPMPGCHAAPAQLCKGIR